MSELTHNLLGRLSWDAIPFHEPILLGTFLAAGATLTKNSRDWSMMVGTPARQVGWVSAFGEKIEHLADHAQAQASQSNASGQAGKSGLPCRINRRS